MENLLHQAIVLINFRQPSRDFIYVRVPLKR